MISRGWWESFPLSPAVSQISASTVEYSLLLVRAVDAFLVLWNETIMFRASESDYTGLSKKMDGIWNRYNLKSTGRIYTFGVLKCSEKFKVLDLP